MASEYRVDDLARAAGTTTRNVRAYQDRGLLPPPRREGRIGIYDETHLARLRLIGSLLDRGYAMAQIAELTSAWEEGKDLTEVLGLERAVSSVWTDEVPVTLPTATVRQVFDAGADDLFDRIVALGVLRVEGDDCVVASPKLMNGFLQLLGYGFTMRELVELDEKLHPSIDSIARLMVEAAANRITTQHGDTWLPEGKEISEVTDMLLGMRKLAASSLQVFFAQAMERHIEEYLGEHLSRVLSDAPKSSDGAA